MSEFYTNMEKVEVDSVLKKAEANNAKLADDPSLTETNENEKILTLPAGEMSAHWTDEEIFAKYKIDPDIWYVTRQTLNHYAPWAKVNGRLYQYEIPQRRIWLERRPDKTLFDIPEIAPWTPPAPRPKAFDKPKLYLVTSDLQIPYFDHKLHDLTCKMANDLKMDGWFDLGDEADLPSISRWDERRPRFQGDLDFGAGIKETKQQLRQVFADRAAALPDYAIKVLGDSNHGERWDAYILKNAPKLWGVVPNLRELAGLPELGWDIVLSSYGSGTYQMAEMEIAKGLIGVHGSEAKGATMGGQSVMQELKTRVGVSVMQGHCNHQALVSYVRGSYGDNRHTVFGAEVGMMADPKMPYGNRRVKDWQMGFSVVEIWPDDHWNINLVAYTNEEIHFRDGVWR